MHERAQCFGPRRIFSSAIEVPDLGFVQRSKSALLRINVNDVFVLPVNHAEHPVP